MSDINTQLEVRAQQYSAMILPLAQQEKSLLLPTVFHRTGVTGKSFYQDQIGSWEMAAKTAPNADTPQNDPNLSRTRVDLATYNDSRMLDRSLLLQELSDPASMTNLNVASAIGRKIDEIIYGALGGTTMRGEQGTNIVSFPSANVIAADFEAAGTNTGLTVAKIQHAAKMLEDKAVRGEFWLVASATAKEQLLKDVKATSGDYTINKPMDSGVIRGFYGFNLVFLPAGIIKKSGNVAEYFAYEKTGVVFGMPETLFLRVDERQDKSYSKQIYYEMTAGAGRLEEARVIKIQGDESVQ